MYIKQVIIEGFRTYREQTVIEPFSPHHNVIVGRNGCGKSNFFKAIQFVLSDEYTNLKDEDRMALLHEGSGPRVMSGFVEIIFDNSDARLPIEKEEVAIKRAIGLKKDQYFLDKKQVTKADIMNFLETAGFSRNNPYYIVKQGKINELSIAKDSFRLKILKEVAGSNVFDEKKEESRVILKDTEDKRKNIAEVVKAIEDRLTQLEVEKEELKEFQKWDKQKRSIEYTMHNKELEQTQHKINELQRARGESSTKSSEHYEQLNLIGEELKVVQKDCKDLHDKEKMLRDECEQLNEERPQLLSKKARLEFDLKDAQDDIENAETNKVMYRNELDTLNKQIEETERELLGITPEYNRIIQQEEHFESERNLCDQQRNELYAKQGRNTRFKSRDERDQWIKNELVQIDRVLKQNETLKIKLTNEIKEEQVRTNNLKREVEQLMQRVNEQQESIDEATRENFDLVRKKEELTTTRNDLWRRENTLTQEIQSIRDEYEKCEQSLRSVTGRTLLQGIESIQTLLRQFKSEGTHGDLIDGYHGLVIDNIECDRSYYTCIETSISSKLFYHIVSSDKVATQFIKLMNKQKLPGEVNYLPLNKLRLDSSVKYPEANDSKPLIEKVKFDQKVSLAIRHVFQRILLCRNADVASLYARQFHLDCVLLDGDLVSSKGALTGGYVDSRQSKLAFHRQMETLKASLNEKISEQETLKNEIKTIDTQLNNLLNDIQKHETKYRRQKDTFDQMKCDTRQKKVEIERLERLRPQKEKSISSLHNDIQLYESKKESLSNEIGTDLRQSLNTQEQSVLDDWNAKIHRLNNQLKDILQARLNIEGKKTRMEHQLNDNLRKKREQLVEKISENRTQNLKTQIEMYESELVSLSTRLDDFDTKIKINERLFKEIQTKSHERQAELDRLNESERKLQDEMQMLTVDLEKYGTKLSVLLKKKEECLKATRNLGVLPQDAYDNRYAEYSTKELYNKLDECNQELKKLSHVNKKAMDQYVQFSEHKEKLIRRHMEADQAYESILDFIGTLDQRKNENMQLTFKQVSKYFHEIFLKLVPQGTAHLIMRRHDNYEEEDRQTQSTEADTQTQAPVTPVDDYTGIGIRVSFVGKTNEMKDIQQLSGGQKSLVALALIFAIQRCDPAPFYLFDEIDQALDPQFRKYVADMIHELSDKAQFITTTFRPELLEHANKYYGVIFRNKISVIDCVSKEEAFNFVEDDRLQK